MSRVVHFEINADNVERASKFYRAVFGWKLIAATLSCPSLYLLAIKNFFDTVRYIDEKWEL